MPFEKGNQLSKGRPRISLTKPELLLPAVFNKGGVNWANDFLHLYRNMKVRKLTNEETNLLAFFEKFMPYLCTKVQLKEIMGKESISPAESVDNAKQTHMLLKALEAEGLSKPSFQS